MPTILNSISAIVPERVARRLVGIVRKMMLIIIIAARRTGAISGRWSMKSNSLVVPFFAPKVSVGQRHLADSKIDDERSYNIFSPKLLPLFILWDISMAALKLAWHPSSM